MVTNNEAINQERAGQERDMQRGAVGKIENCEISFDCFVCIIRAMTMRYYKLNSKRVKNVPHVPVKAH